MTDVLARLLPTSYKGIGFPSQVIEAAGGHGVVAHKRVDRNGWRLENTGRDSIGLSIRIPFVNSIFRGRNETWSQGQLFPDVYDRMIQVVQERTTGTFVHPIYGALLMKVEKWRDTLDPDFRGGPTLQVQLLESVDEGDADIVGVDDEGSLAESSARAVDAGVAFLPGPPAPDGFESFTAFVRAVQTVGSQADLARSQAVAKIDRVIAQVEQLGELASPSNPTFLDSSGRLVSSLRGLQASLATTSSTKGFYEVLVTSSVAALSNRLLNTPVELLALNPWMAASPFVPARVRVRHYVRSL